MLKRFLFLLVFYGSVPFLGAQTDPYIFKNYDVKNGLCDNTINSIISDDKGFIWIGTREGLSRFDGAEFKNYYFSNHSNSIGNYYSSFIKLGRNQIMLLNNSKLAILNTSNYSLHYVQKFSNTSISNLTQVSNDVIALLTPKTIILINHKFEKIATLSTINGKAFTSVQPLSNTKLLLSDFHNFYQYDLQTKKTTPFFIEAKSFFKANYSNFRVEHIDQENQLIYIVDYFTGLYLFNFKGKLVRSYNKNSTANSITSNNIIRIHQTSNEQIWLATDKGISILKEAKPIAVNHNKTNNLSLKNDIVTFLYEDANSNIWIGTVEGLSVYKNRLNLKVDQKNFTYKDESYVASIAIANDQLFFGTYLSNTYAFDQNTQQSSMLKNVPPAWGVQIVKDEICINGGAPEVTFYHQKTNQYRKTDFLKNYFKNTDIVTLVFQHSNGDMWYSGNAGGGFVREKSNSRGIEHYIKDPNGKQLFTCSYYHEAVEDADQNLWFGVNKSNLIVKWDYQKNTFKEYDFNERKSVRRKIFGGITSMKSDIEKNIWIAYEGGGIVKFNPKTDEIKHYNITNGLNTNFINTIEFDAKNRLWMLTNKGISCIQTIDNTIYHMNVWDGFTANPMTYTVLKMDHPKNQMLIGSNSCFYTFNPDEIIKNKVNATKLYLDVVKVNNTKNIDLTATSFEFKPSENNFEFEIVAIDIENGENLEYGYKLEGFNNQWININNNKTIIFPKLNAGYYSFNARVRAKGNNHWIYLKKPFAFTIDRYWYQTWWFYMLLSFVTVLLLFFLISFYFKQKLEKQKNELEKQKAIEDERKRIAKDMHDDLGSGLTKITYLSQMAMLNKSSDENIAHINKTSTELVESMSEIIWVMKDENNSWEELLLYIKKYAVEYSSNNNLSAIFDYPDTLIQSELSGEKRRNIFLSIKEVLHNIVKHAQATEVTIKVIQNNQIQITIADNGIGITATKSQKKSSGNGQKNIIERMKLVNGSVTVEEHNGTRIHFIIPI